MRYVIFGINNTEFFDIRDCEFADSRSEAEEIRKGFERKYPLVLVEGELEA